VIGCSMPRCDAVATYRTFLGDTLCSDHAADVAPYEIVFPISPGVEAPRSRPTVCWRGHDLTDPENFYERPNGQRYCRICRNTNRRRHRKENHAPTSSPL
jgi:hypothetical protein